MKQLLGDAVVVFLAFAPWVMLVVWAVVRYG